LIHTFNNAECRAKFQTRRPSSPLAYGPWLEPVMGVEAFDLLKINRRILNMRKRKRSFFRSLFSRFFSCSNSRAGWPVRGGAISWVWGKRHSLPGVRGVRIYVRLPCIGLPLRSQLPARFPVNHFNAKSPGRKAASNKEFNHGFRGWHG
jgi:hypothetical protein